jgi:3-hydroxyisobutyrate dehydrogenase
VLGRDGCRGRSGGPLLVRPGSGSAPEEGLKEIVMADREPSLAVLGLGTMGRAMAGSALRSGIPTTVWNRKPDVARRMADQGAEVAMSAADAVRAASMTITMVTDAEAVQSIAVDLGMLEALPTGSVWAQMSTIGIEGTATIHSIVEKQRPDVLFLDAPVSGSKIPAEQGRLTIFASGSEQARPTAGTVFAALGQRTVWLGRVGMGSRMKLVNNTLLAFGAEGVANSLALAKRMGLEVGSVLDAFADGPLVSPWMAAKISRIGDGNYSPEFPLVLALKDVHLALEQADPERFTVLSSLAREWEQLISRGLGDEDVTVVTRSLEN